MAYYDRLASAYAKKNPYGYAQFANPTVRALTAPLPQATPAQAITATPAPVQAAVAATPLAQPDPTAPVPVQTTTGAGLDPAGGGGGADINGPEWDIYNNTMPSWMKGDSYAYDHWKDLNTANIKQAWWRDPSALAYSGDPQKQSLIYHPYWGWQYADDVRAFYGKADSPVTWSEFLDAGWERHPDQDWTKYYQTLPPGYNEPGGPGYNAGDDYGYGGEWYNPGYTGPDPDPTYKFVGPPTGDNRTLNLDIYGWTGPVDVNDYEAEALDFIQELYRTQAPLDTMVPAQAQLEYAVNGGYAPYGEAYRGAVTDSMRTKAYEDYDRASKALATRFSERGGYFGGQHSKAQTDLARGVIDDLSARTAELNLEGFSKDVDTRMAASEALRSLGTTQAQVFDSMLQQILKGGELLTSREALNRAEVQGAEERSYQDWLRANNEQMSMFNTALALLGYQPTTPIAQQPQPSGWSSLLGALGGGVGQAGGSALFSLLGLV